MQITELVAFSIVWIILIYVGNCFLQRRILFPDCRVISVYASTTILIGVFGEVFLNSVYFFIFNKPLWLYHLLPVHSSYTSLYSIFIWGLYGFHLYLFHDNLKKYKISSVRALSLIIAVEAVILEVLFNSSYFVLTGQYIFYYLPGDIWHFTSLQAIPLYFLGGVVLVKSLKKFTDNKSDSRFFIIMNLSLTFVLMFLS